MSYRDLLSEAARRRDAETRAEKAEAKLARIGALEVYRIDPEALGWISADHVQRILDDK